MHAFAADSPPSENQLLHRDIETWSPYARNELRRVLPDFSQWTDHDPYQAEFKKLLTDIKAPTPALSE